MLLYDVFMLLHLHKPYALLKEGTLERLSSTHITHSDVDSAIKNKVAAYRCFFFDAPKHRIQTLQRAYDDFLMQCKQALNTSITANLFPVVIDFLDKGCYVNQALQLLGFHPKTAAEALRITPLAIHYIDNPEAFASLIGWLIANQVTPETIINTHVVQDYFRYHLFDLNNPDSAITTLHALLKAEVETAGIANQLTQTRCPEDELSSYALDGSIQNPNTLNNPERSQPFCETPLDQVQFDALKRLFGVIFLRFALANLPHHHDFLAKTLNADARELKVLPELLSHVQSHEAQKRVLVECLSEETIDALIDARVSGVLTLLPYSAYLRDRISQADLDTYLHAIRENDPSHLDLIGGLFELLNLFKHHNESSAQRIFAALIDEILKDPICLDDEYVLKKLRKFRPGQEILSKTLADLEATFNQCIQDHVFTSEFDYISVEDIWRNINIKISAIQRIDNQPTSFPKDKHELHILLAQTIFKKQPFHLDAFMNTLGIEPVFHPVDTTPYERFLINMLAALDDHALRFEIVARLDSQISQTKNWRASYCASTSLAQQACEQGNLGLIIWHESAGIKLKKSIEFLVNIAAERNHWHVVQYFQNTYPLKQVIVDNLLHLAVRNKTPRAIHLLWENHYHTTPSRHAIERAFINAVLQADLKCTQALLTCSVPPCDTVLIKGFRQAIQTGQFSLAWRVAEDRYSPYLQDVINQMFLDAARLNKKVGIIYFLGSLKINPITQNTLDNALKVAIRSGNTCAAKALLCLPNLTPRKEAKKQAMQQALKKGKHRSCVELFKMVSPKKEASIPPSLSFFSCPSPGPTTPVKKPRAYKTRVQSLNHFM